jgi:hypothetical protein
MPSAQACCEAGIRPARERLQTTSRGVRKAIGAYDDAACATEALSMQVYLDDERATPEGWVRVY